MPERLGVMKKTDWWKYLVVAVLYGASVSLFRWLAVPHYLLLSGVHVTALMLVPYRYWPSMIIAEILVQIPMAIENAPNFGVLWSVIMLVPSIMFTGPVIYAFRRRWHLIDKDAHVHTGMLLACALVVSVVITLDDLVLLSTVSYPPGFKPVHHDHIAAQWLLGNFLGILTVVPTALVMRQALWRRGLRQSLHALADSRVVFESVCLIIPVMGALLWLGFTEPHLRGFAQVAMFVPVVWLALRHGWQGAALGGTAASLALVWLMPENFDRTTIQAEVVVAFATSTMLLVGARIEALDRRAEKEREEVRIALALAQRNVYLGEMQLRMTAQALEQARETVRSGFALMMGRLRHLQPAIDDGGYQQVAQAAQDQLFGISDSLHPVVWRERGLAAALREGAVARMLDHAGIRYWCEFKGPVSCLSTTLHLSLYRMICEAIAEGCRDRTVSDVCVRIRAGDVGGRRWVAVSALFQASENRMPFVRWDDLLPRLMRTASGMGLKAIKDRAATFEGYARERTTSQGRRISWMMRDV